MFGGTFFRVVAVLALVGLLVAAGAGIYNAGISEGLAEAAQAAAASGDPAPVVIPPYGGYGPGWGYGHGWGGGFGFFGIFFFILGIFLVFALLRAAFGWGRWGGPGGSGGGWQSRRERMEELHRDLHRQTDAPGGSTT